MIKKLYQTVAPFVIGGVKFSIILETKKIDNQKKSRGTNCFYQKEIEYFKKN